MDDKHNSTVDVQQETEKFMKRLSEGYFHRDRSVNTEVVYHLEKEQKDTEAVISFLQTDLFKQLSAIE